MIAVDDFWIRLDAQPLGYSAVGRAQAAHPSMTI